MKNLNNKLKFAGSLALFTPFLALNSMMAYEIFSGNETFLSEFLYNITSNRLIGGVGFALTMLTYSSSIICYKKMKEEKNSNK